MTLTSLFFIDPNASGMNADPKTGASVRVEWRRAVSGCGLGAEHSMQMAPEICMALAQLKK